MRRVVITGCGTINALGNNVPETWNCLQQGKNGITNLDICDIDRLSSTVGAQIKIEDNVLKNLLDFTSNDSLVPEHLLNLLVSEVILKNFC